MMWLMGSPVRRFTALIIPACPKKKNAALIFCGAVARQVTRQSRGGDRYLMQPESGGQ